MAEVLFRSRLRGAVERRITGEELFAPDLIDVEVAAVYRRAVIRGEASIADAVAALDVLASWPIARIPNRHLVQPGARWWQNVTACDAVYVALAVADDSVLITTDGPLARAPVPEARIEVVSLG